MYSNDPERLPTFVACWMEDELCSVLEQSGFQILFCDVVYQMVIVMVSASDIADREEIKHDRIVFC